MGVGRGLGLPEEAWKLRTGPRHRAHKAAGSEHQMPRKQATDNSSPFSLCHADHHGESCCSPGRSTLYTVVRRRVTRTTGELPAASGPLTRCILRNVGILFLQQLFIHSFIHSSLLSAYHAHSSYTACCLFPNV